MIACKDTNFFVEQYVRNKFFVFRTQNLLPATAAEGVGRGGACAVRVISPRSSRRGLAVRLFCTIFVVRKGLSVTGPAERPGLKGAVAQVRRASVADASAVLK